MKKHIFKVYFILFLVLGAIIRIVSEGDLIFSDLVYIKKSRVEDINVSSPIDVVIAFYSYIDSGQYEKAWEISVEPEWIKESPGNLYKQKIEADCSNFNGFTSKEDFVRRSRDEIGPAGSWLSIQNIEAEPVQESPTGIKNCVKDALNNARAYTVLVRGQILGACGIYEWRKYVTVFEIDGRYRILLPGEKKAKALFYQEWFGGIKKIADLRKGTI